MKWVIIFAIVLVLGHGHIVLDMDEVPSVLGLPAWLFYYIVVHLIFVALLHRYSNHIDEEAL